MKKLLYILTAICFCCCTNNQQEQVFHPRAITMWDFSWLERRWPGAGFEDWDLALDELTERGYNAVRIEAYPHLVGVNPTKEWVLDEVWNQQDWGSPDRIKVQVQPALNEFIRKCGERDIRVGLSSWYRTDTTHQEMTITTPEIMAQRWINTLKTIDDAGLLDNILYVDLCNEWPGNIWAPFFNALYPKVYWGQWDAPESMEWMQKAIALVRDAYPDLPLVFSTDSQDLWRFDNDLSYFDLVEHHIWMANQKQGEFLKAIDYKNGRFDPQAYKNVQANAERVYREKPDYWNNLLLNQINETAAVAKRIGKPLITTECWGIIDYKDWPMLNWDWVKDLCEMGVKEAAATGQWVGIATSNFCAPQFVGMWRDVEWHRRLTTLIKSSPINPELLKSEEAQKLLKRL
ncbi:MAG: cellulase [Bacteroidaceae bacterium]|nr:cellulase [Bacteroidaceae bacterium]